MSKMSPGVRSETIVFSPKLIPVCRGQWILTPCQVFVIWMKNNLPLSSQLIIVFVMRISPHHDHGTSRSDRSSASIEWSFCTLQSNIQFEMPYSMNLHGQCSANQPPIDDAGWSSVYATSSWRSTDSLLQNQRYIHVSSPAFVGFVLKLVARS